MGCLELLEFLFLFLAILFLENTFKLTKESKCKIIAMVLNSQNVSFKPADSFSNGIKHGMVPLSQECCFPSKFKC